MWQMVQYPSRKMPGNQAHQYYFPWIPKGLAPCFVHLSLHCILFLSCSWANSVLVPMDSVHRYNGVGWRTVTYWGPITPKTAAVYFTSSLFHLLSLLPIVSYSTKAKWDFFLLKVCMGKLVSKVWASKKQSKLRREAPQMLATIRTLSSYKNGLLSNHGKKEGFPCCPRRILPRPAPLMESISYNFYLNATKGKEFSYCSTCLTRFF